MSIYEGTSGIQSLDLLGRKVVMEKGKALQALLRTIGDTIDKADTYESLKPYSKALKDELMRIQTVLSHISKFAANGELDRYLSDATIFMELLGYIVVAWQWLKQATIAYTQLQAANFGKQSKEFYEGKVHTMKFFFRYELPHAEACAKTMMDGEFLTNLKKPEVLA